MQAFHDRWLRPDNATLLVVGDTTLEQVKPLLEKYLAAWKAPSEPLPKKNLASVSAQAKPRVFLVNRTGAEQTLILGGYAGPSRSDPDYIALETLNTILGGGFVSRLNMNLREDKHWAYGAGSGLSAAEGPGPFFVRAPVQTDKTSESVQEILKELRGIPSARSRRPTRRSSSRATASCCSSRAATKRRVK